MKINYEIMSLLIGLIVLIGIACCFFGYRIFKLILGLTGFVIGGSLAGTAGYGISGGKEAVTFLAGIVGGLIGAALIVTLYLIGVFLIGAFLGGLLGGVLFAVFNSNPESAVLLILAITCGVLALFYQKHMIILSTAFGGAWSVVTGISFFTAGNFNFTNVKQFLRFGGTHLYVTFFCWIALGIAGFIVQYKPIPKAEEQKQIHDTSKALAD